MIFDHYVIVVCSSQRDASILLNSSVSGSVKLNTCKCC